MSSESRLKRLGLNHLANNPEALNQALLQQLANDQLAQRAGINLLQPNPQTLGAAPQTAPADPTLPALTAAVTQSQSKAPLPSPVAAPMSANPQQ